MAEKKTQIFDVAERVGKQWTDGNGVTHTWTEADEKAHQAWNLLHRQVKKVVNDSEPTPKS